MDYSPFFAAPSQDYNIMAGSLQMPSGFTNEDGKMGGAQEGNFDPSALFQTPYDSFRFDPLLASTPGTDVNSISLQMPGDSSALTATESIEQLTPIEFGRTDRRSSSEEKEILTPAQSRRKAQNRAAQRAFRERKERHVKELEATLSELQSSATSLASDNQRLKLALQRAKTENEILRSTSGAAKVQPLSSPKHRRKSRSVIGSSHGTSGDDFDSSDSQIGGLRSSSDGHRSSGLLLSAGATWDVIVEHPLVKTGQVDITDVCERLRRTARCDGSGTVFAEKEVRRAVEESRRGGGDELI